jgi:hypothetical protein
MLPFGITKVVFEKLLRAPKLLSIHSVGLSSIVLLKSELLAARTRMAWLDVPDVVMLLELITLFNELVTLIP